MIKLIKKIFGKKKQEISTSKTLFGGVDVDDKLNQLNKKIDNLTTKKMAEPSPVADTCVNKTPAPAKKPGRPKGQKSATPKKTPAKKATPKPKP